MRSRASVRSSRLPTPIDVGKKKKSTKGDFKKKCCDKPLRKMCKRCPRRRCSIAA